ncbi:MAG: hypothetical protein DMG98_28420, partial [Acidobacteria bacterium]
WARGTPPVGASRQVILFFVGIPKIVLTSAVGLEPFFPTFQAARVTFWDFDMRVGSLRTHVGIDSDGDRHFVLDRLR